MDSPLMPQFAAPNPTVGAAPLATRAFQGETADSLQGCLAWMLKHYKLTHSIPSLITGLPLKNNRLTPELFGRAAQRAGLACRVLNRKARDINPIALPAVAMLRSGRAAILQAIQPAELEAGRHYKLLNTFTGETDTLDDAQMAEAYAETLVLVKSTLRTQVEQEIGDPAKQWFWGTLRQFKPLYYKVGVAALIINMVALVSPLFMMN
ncbi:MAG: hypothetical protein ACK5YK_02335, partial [Pseudomonadota bacterium]